MIDITIMDMLSLGEFGGKGVNLKKLERCICNLQMGDQILMKFDI